MIEIKIPSPGESITEVEVSSWLVEDGSYVEKDQEIAEIESDKATLPLIAEESGAISIKIKEGETAKVGAIACTIDTAASKPAKEESATGEKKEEEKPVKESEKAKEDKEGKKAKEEEGAPGEEPHGKNEKSDYKDVKATPVAKKMMQEHHLNVDDVINGLKKISKQEVEAVLSQKSGDGVTKVPTNSQDEISRDEDRQKMSQLRKKLSKRLVAVKNETAMLTTFNEVDMSAIIEIRKKYQKKFIDKHGIKLGFMSFFTKAVTLALTDHPSVNSHIEEDEIVSPEYKDIGIAVQTPKGLMVPVLRNAESMNIPDIELKIKELADKARKGRISIDDLSGGTFTITNGGVFGSLLSTPILNPPQSGILGMHAIQDRAVAINGKVEVRPMMYIALSYDHRIIDGKDSVGFLVKLKSYLENPGYLLAGTSEPEKDLLNL